MARGRVGAAIAFISGVSEATFLPVLPEVPVALLGAAAPERTLPLALWASAGSASGGILTYVAGAAFGGERILSRVPLVTDAMRTWAASEMHMRGTRVLWPQPWTGVPFKVFGYQARESGLPFRRYLLVSTASRSNRVMTVGGTLAAAGVWLRRGSRYGYPLFAVGLVAIYAEFLRRMVRHWSRSGALPPLAK